MDIDRATFLSLTFGLAGLGACSSNPPPVAAATVVDIPLQPPVDAGAPALGPPSMAAPSGSASAARARDDDDPGSPVAEDGAPSRDVAYQACGIADPKTVARPTAACADHEGTAPTCATMKACRGFPFPRQECESFRRHFKPKVAARAIDCLSRLSSKATCDDACNTYRCGNLALQNACPDPAVDAQCKQAVAACSKVTMSECQIYLSGMNAAGRTKMLSCITGCQYGIHSCSEGL